jgi:hypothetical protein
MSDIKLPTSGPGSQMGTKSRAILECLRKNGRKNRLDLEMLLNMGPLGPALSRLGGMSYVIRGMHGSATGCYEITRQGRAALGEALELTPPQEIRVCNATMSGRYIPEIHNTARIGVARA